MQSWCFSWSFHDVEANPLNWSQLIAEAASDPPIPQLTPPNTRREHIWGCRISRPSVSLERWPINNQMLRAPRKWHSNIDKCCAFHQKWRSQSTKCLPLPRKWHSNARCVCHTKRKVNITRGCASTSGNTELLLHCSIPGLKETELLLDNTATWWNWCLTNVSSKHYLKLIF